MATEGYKSPADILADGEHNHLTMYVYNQDPENGASIIITRHRPTDEEKRNYRMIRRLLFDGVTLHMLVAGQPITDEAVARLARSVVERDALVLHIDLRTLGLDPWHFESWKKVHGRKK